MFYNIISGHSDILNFNLFWGQSFVVFKEGSIWILVLGKDVMDTGVQDAKSEILEIFFLQPIQQVSILMRFCMAIND